MKRMMLASVAILTVMSSSALTQTPTKNDADTAKAMLTRAVAAVKADKAKALSTFNTGGDGFLAGELYVFCFNTIDGKFMAEANPQVRGLIGQDIRTLKDPQGRAYGMDLYAAGQKPEGQFTEVSYFSVRPGASGQVPKVSFVTRVADIACGVGYYK